MKYRYLLAVLLVVACKTKTPEATGGGQAQVQTQEPEQEPGEVKVIKAVPESTFELAEGVTEQWIRVGTNGHEAVIITDKPHRVICYGHIVPTTTVNIPLLLSCAPMFPDADAGK
jgi:hypothetical protein